VQTGTAPGLLAFCGPGDGTTGTAGRPPYDVAMHGNRAPGWWPTRILLAIGIASVVVMGFCLFVLGDLGGSVNGNWIQWEPVRVTQPLRAIAVLLVAAVGLIWMIRIYRGPRDEPPPWRHRDH
jgi:uncharacterized BrkB/YihY/UPF0761 family membrane protein